jgi:hypothetical protein
MNITGIMTQPSSQLHRIIKYAMRLETLTYSFRPHRYTNSDKTARSLRVVITTNPCIPGSIQLKRQRRKPSRYLQKSYSLHNNSCLLIKLPPFVVIMKSLATPASSQRREVRLHESRRYTGSSICDRGLLQSGRADPYTAQSASRLLSKRTVSETTTITTSTLQSRSLLKYLLMHVRGETAGENSSNNINDLKVPSSVTNI